MPRDVIVEGPDGAGKTTLIKQLTERFPVTVHERACTSEGGPVTELYEWTEKNLAELVHVHTPMLYDRHPGFSELVYGPILRGDIGGCLDESTWREGVHRVLRERAFVIWCLPPVGTVVTNLFHNYADNTAVQMDGVTEHIRELHAAYTAMSLVWNGPAFTYDYTKSQHRKVIETIVSHELGVL